ncbi:7566_t:CDS:1 [Acaulospora morrowiae]|uniref:7566_t:CDS:1 n=1 Tax=Acaulospora morrowiae TaxID=94023 RepID=A0A9N8V619_9GLOM|nr:7566_t:CDS:1 [Acaulospora morrowiae]
MNHQRQSLSSLPQENMPLIIDSKIHEIHFYGPSPLSGNLIRQSEIQHIYFHQTTSSPDVLSQTSTVDVSTPTSRGRSQDSEIINEAEPVVSGRSSSETDENSTIEDSSSKCQITLTEKHIRGLISRMFD